MLFFVFALLSYSFVILCFMLKDYRALLSTSCLCLFSCPTCVPLFNHTLRI